MSLIHRHTKVFPGKFSCVKCTKVYTQQRNLTRHLNFECGVRRKGFYCPKCDGFFTRIDSLKRHVKTICGKVGEKDQRQSRPWVCAICNNAFKMKHHLKTHLIRVHNKGC
ncbi:hypothetical protein HUJ04_008553 [Dendroctonus ponderosae]|nr:hypothetical protein HUJ04_008553 [Dendroctonus ponderosae]